MPMFCMYFMCTGETLRRPQSLMSSGDPSRSGRSGWGV